MRRLLVVLMLFAVTACGPADEAPPAAGPTQRPPSTSSGNEGRPKPPRDAAADFTITTFDGERFSLAEQRGNPVVLNFWESW